ncbi:MAG: beta-glucuronidase [Prevotella sp.]|nr:beta-glucuronidase [Prevotella sp.]
MNKKLALALLASHFTLLTSFAQQALDLSGQWSFGTGDEPIFNDYIILPNSMITAGKGDDVTAHTHWTGSTYDSSYYFNPAMERYRMEANVKFPFFLTPAKHYVGSAWYERTIVVPKSWKQKPVVLFLERPHIETTVYVNGHKAGHQLSLSTPHEYDITPYVRFGKKNSIRIRVYNGIENVGVGQDSHSVTDQTQGNWNGIVGRIELRQAATPVIRVSPDIAARSVTIHVGTDSVYTFLLGDSMQLWNEHHPHLYTRQVSYHGQPLTLRFGLRDISIRGPQFYLNGQPIWLRGTVENCCFPETGYPPTDVASWVRIFEKCREYGLNHMRFHSYCPPEAAFEAADRMGFYLQPEGPSWPNHGVKLGRGQVIDEYLLAESKRIVDTYGHHPSFVMMAAGNEPAGDWVSYCNNWVKAMKAYDPSKVYCGASVGGGWAWDDGSEYHVKGGARGLDWDKHAPHSDDVYRLYPQKPSPSLQPTPSRGEGCLDSPVKENVNSKTNQAPLPSGGDGGGCRIAHEQGQWCAFPDFKEIPQYTGAYQARNFEIFRDLLAENGMASQAEKFLQASSRLQHLAYKYEIERNLRTPDYAGFQLLGLNDYSGQGTALVGPLNVHWREKGWEAPPSRLSWREFCSPVVPLARFSKFVYENTDTLVVPVELYNASGAPLEDARCTYYIHDDEGREYAHGLLAQKDIPVGKNIPLGVVGFDLSPLRKAVKMTLTVAVATSRTSNLDGAQAGTNHWNFWVYPDLRSQGDKEYRSVDISHSTLHASHSTLHASHSTLHTSHSTLHTSQDKCLHSYPPKLLHSLAITDSLDAKALAVLADGGDVLITAAGKVRFGNDVVHQYLPVFWNTSWFKMRPPHTTGAYIEKDHPVFADFPTDDWQDLQWWELVNKAQVMNLSEFPRDYQPIVQPIDTWHVSRKLGMLLEARVLRGRLLMTTMDITSNLDHRPVARQLRQSILNYMQSDRFQPAIQLDPQVITNLFERTAPPVSMFTNESPDELKPALK